MRAFSCRFFHWILKAILRIGQEDIVSSIFKEKQAQKGTSPEIVELDLNFGFLSGCLQNLTFLVTPKHCG